MVNSKCFVYGCTSGFEKERKQNKIAGVKNPTLFSAPKDPILFEKWKKDINRDGFSADDKVCEKHFQADQIIRHEVMVLKGGIIHREERTFPRLAKDAVPSIFSGPKYLSSTARKRKPPKDRSAAAGASKPTGKKPKANDVTAGVDIEPDDEPANLQENFDFDKLKNFNIDDDSWIRCERRPEIVTFIHLNDNHLPDISIVISQELIPKGFLDRVPVSLPIDRINSSDDLLLLFEFLKNALHCPGPEVFDCACEKDEKKCEKIVPKANRGEHFQKKICPPCQSQRLREKRKKHITRRSKNKG